MVINSIIFLLTEILTEWTDFDDSFLFESWYFPCGPFLNSFWSISDNVVHEKITLVLSLHLVCARLMDKLLNIMTDFNDFFYWKGRFKGSLIRVWLDSDYRIRSKSVFLLEFIIQINILIIACVKCEVDSRTLLSRTQPDRT